MSEEQKPRGRGGRGQMLLDKYKQAKGLQPGLSTSSSSDSTPPVRGLQDTDSAQSIPKARCTVPSATISSGYGTASGHASSDSGTRSIGRGAMLAQYLATARKTEGTAGQETQSRRTEDDLSSATSKLALSGAEDTVDQNIHRGQQGQPFNAATNWIRLSLSPDKSVFEYMVQFKPEVDSMKLRNELLNGQKEIIGTVKSFDGVKLWLPYLMPDKVTNIVATNRLTEENVKITITFQIKTSMETSVQLYNVLFNRAMKHLDMVRVRRNYYLKSQAIAIRQHSLEIWPGYVTAAHHMKGGVMLCVDVSHKILKTVTIHQLMSDIAQSSSTYENPMKHELLGKVVLTRYNNKTYRIDGIDFKQNPLSTFKTSRGEISYVDYYKRSYDITINDLKQPMLINRPKKTDVQGQPEDILLYLVPELCYATGLTDEMRADFRIMKDISEHTRITPQARIVSLTRFINGINRTSAAKQVLADWGITLCETVIHPQGRVLPPEAIIFGGNKKIQGTEKADWGRESCRERVLQPVPLPAGEWAVIYVERNATQANKFMTTYSQICGALGINAGKPLVDQLNRDNTDTYLTSIKKMHSQKVRMIVIIFPSQREDRYSAVKRLTCSDLGVATQCINSRTISNDSKLRSVTQKIALQINCKMGGELWAVHIPSTEIMVCGIDVYHDPARRNPSVVGWVSSTNPGMTRWKSSVTTQGKGQEISDALMISLRDGLKAFFKENNRFPKKVVIFRDGVGDGQLSLTESHEIPQLTTVFNEIPNYDPEFYFIVVQKRINTRIFRDTNNRFENPPPGSVIDNVITKRNMFDFLLVSQNVRQGTVSPTYFIILKNSGSLSPDHLQKLSYKMTHMYYNWAGTVRVPAPCLYAHKVAYLVGQNIRKQVDPSLTDRLYFL